MSQISWENAIMIQVTAEMGAETRNNVLVPSFWLRYPPARQPNMLPIKNKLAIQDASLKLIIIGLSSPPSFDTWLILSNEFSIIFGMVTLVKDIQVPITHELSETAEALRYWGKAS